jgi:release factor glutamine methyltransferase
MAERSEPLAAAWAACAPARPGRAGRFIGRALRRAYELTGTDRYDAVHLEWLHSTPLLVIPSVFSPVRLRTGAFLAAQLDARTVAAEAAVLDMGTGSGVCAVQAAQRARRVVAVDVNPAAVRCATINALLNRVEARVEVRHGDLFDPVGGERFDLIVFNPPFVRGAPRNDRDRAWRSLDVAERFAAGLPRHLRPGGCALVLLSSFGDAQHFLAQFARQRLHTAVLAERRFFNERLAVLRVAPAAHPGVP